MKKFVVALIKLSAWAVPVAVLCVFAYMMVNNTKLREIKDCVVTINVVEAKSNKAANDEVQISKSAFENALRQSAYAARQEAQNEYDKSFSTLLTILAIFGIAWPVIVGVMQYKFNEKELNKIQATDEKANAASDGAQKASSDANQAKDKANAASDNATRALNKANEASANANKAIEEIKETDLSVKKLVDLFKSSSSDQWEMLSLVYTKSAIRMNKSGEDKTFPSTLNFNRLMNVWCKCFKIQFGQLNKFNISDADGIKNYLSNISPEKTSDDMSPINKAVVKSIIKSLDAFIERNQEQPVRESLDDLKKMAMGLLDAYKKLVPDGAPEDLNV